MPGNLLINIFLWGCLRERKEGKILVLTNFRIPIIKRNSIDLNKHLLRTRGRQRTTRQLKILKFVLGGEPLSVCGWEGHDELPFGTARYVK